MRWTKPTAAAVFALGVFAQSPIAKTFRCVGFCNVFESTRIQPGRVKKNSVLRIFNQRLIIIILVSFMDFSCETGIILEKFQFRIDYNTIVIHDRYKSQCYFPIYRTWRFFPILIWVTNYLTKYILVRIRIAYAYHRCQWVQSPAPRRPSHEVPSVVNKAGRCAKGNTERENR